MFLLFQKNRHYGSAYHRIYIPICFYYFGSSVPSWADIKVAADRKYKYGLIAAHDGTIFKYRITGEINRLYYDSAVAKLDRLGYTNDSLKEFCSVVCDAGVEMEVL